jgi:uncharacterized protein involved in exopolysaccharide biosynthesis
MPTTTSSDPDSVDGTRQRPYRDEVSLFDLWDVLVKRRWWIIGALLVATVAAPAYLLLTRPTFESHAVVRIGRFAGDPVTAVDVLALELEGKYGAGQAGRQRPYLAAVRPQNGDGLVLRASADSPADAQRYLEGVVSKLVAAQRRPYDSARQSLERTLAAVEAQIAALNTQIAGLGELAERSDIDGAVRALVVLQRSSLQSTLPALHGQWLKIQQDLSSLRTYPIEVVRAPVAPEAPSEPKPLRVIAGALLLGIFLGAAGAAVAEFLHQAKRRRHTLGQNL